MADGVRPAARLPFRGGVAKLIVDKDGTAVAAVATLYPNMPDAEDVVWGITAEEAEDIVGKRAEADGVGSVTWLMAGDSWVCLNEDTPLPDAILFTYQEDCVYELPTEGLA